MSFPLTAQSCWGQWRSLNNSWHAPSPQEHQLDQELDWPSAEKIQPDEEARVTSSLGRGSQEQKGPSAFQTGLKTKQAPTVGSAAFSVRCRRNICWAPSTVAPFVTLSTPLLVHAHMLVDHGALNSSILSSNNESFELDFLQFMEKIVIGMPNCRGKNIWENHYLYKSYNIGKNIPRVLHFEMIVVRVC